MPAERDIATRRAELSAARRALLEKRIRGGPAPSSSDPPVEKRPSDAPALLSFAQQRLWFLEKIGGGGPFYNIPEAWTLRGILHLDSLVWSVKEIVRRHEVLRTSFVAEEGHAVQLVLPDESFSVGVVDLRDLPASEREARTLQVLGEEARRPFDLTQGPLFRAFVLRLEDSHSILLLVMHHAVSDGWSFGVLTRELSTLYDARVAGRPNPLPPLPIQYSDYSYWQRQWLRGEVLQSQLDYWKGQLGSDMPLLQLPSVRPRTPVQTFRGAKYYLELPKALSEAAESLGKAEGVSLFMVLLAVFDVLMYRYSGLEDVAVGVPIANRSRSETEGMIGFFVNTLVMRTDLSGDPIFRELLQRVREAALGAYSHQDLPFDRLVEELRPKRDLSYNPLFQVMFVLQNMPQQPLELSGLAVDRLKVDTRTSMFDLTLYLTAAAEGLEATFEYSTDLFDEAAIERMGRHFRMLLEAVTVNPASRISALPLLTAKERHQLLVEWNDTATGSVIESPIHELFEAQADRMPDAKGVILGQESLTFRQLNERANQLAGYLGRLGIGAAEPVGLLLDRSIEAVVGMLGILKAGGAYVPMDVAYPAERLSFMVTDSGASVLLTRARFLRLVPGFYGRAVCLDEDWGEILREQTETPAASVTAEDPAYVIYTSGSTGVPKGVVGLHRGAVNRFRWMWKAYPFRDGEVCCQKTSLSFVDSIWELFGPLLRGVPLVIIPDEILMDPNLFVEQLAEHRISRIVMVPSLLRVLLSTFPDLGDRLPALALWISSGESLPLELALQFREQMPRKKLINLYGCSEVSADATFYDASAGQLPPRVPVGRPIDNTRVYVLDPSLQPVPVGVTGEVCVGGAGVASGYHSQPQLSAERFVDSPFVPQDRLFRTGDLGRFMPDGQLVLLGRGDQQVKIRGFRVELGEIEATLRSHPLVRESVAIMDGTAAGTDQILAYVVPEADGLPDSEALRDYVRLRLPEYMVPSLVMPLDTMPLTPAGKIDRLNLPLPQRGGVIPGARSTSTGDPVESRLAAIWSRVLGVERVGPDDNFFALGGHSLLAAELFAAIEREIGKRIPLASLFRAPTLRELAAVVRAEQETHSWSSLVAVQPQGTRPPLFLVHGAEGNVLLYRELAHYLGEDQPVYGLQAKGLDGTSPLTTSIQEMAADYAREIRSFQPSGPYFLGGYCMGGGVAFEIAQQLRALGESVAFVALLETYNVSADLDGLTTLHRSMHRMQRIKFQLDNLLLAGSREGVKFFAQKARVEQARFRLTLRAWWLKVSALFGRTGRELYPHLRVAKVNDSAFERYRPQPYDGRVALFRPRKYFAGLSDSHFAWGPAIVGRLEVITLPVSPRGMLVEPFVKSLAQELKAQLDDAHRNSHLEVGKAEVRL